MVCVCVRWPLKSFPLPRPPSPAFPLFRSPLFRSPAASVTYWVDRWIGGSRFRFKSWWCCHWHLCVASCQLPVQLKIRLHMNFSKCFFRWPRLRDRAAMKSLPCKLNCRLQAAEGRHGSRLWVFLSFSSFF